MIVILIGRSTDRLFKWNYRKERAILTRGIRKGGNRLTAIPNGDYVDIFELTRSISWKDPDHTYPDTSYVLQLWPLSLKGSAHKKKIGSFHAEDEFDKAIEKWNSQQEQLAIETEPHHSYEAVGLAKSLNNNRR